MHTHGIRKNSLQRIFQASALACLVLWSLAGCNRSTPEIDPAAGSSQILESPAQVVARFMEALKSGDTATASDLLTPTARQKTEEAKLEVGLPASKTAVCEVGEFEIIDEEGAHVASTWTDAHEDGEQRTDKIVWILRKESIGWRVAGMAMKIFDDAQPLILNFEDPADMMRKQQLAEEELMRRAEAEQTEGTPAKQLETAQNEEEEQSTQEEPKQLETARKRENKLRQ